MSKKVYAVVTKILPENSWQLHEICTTEEKAWQEVEKIYYNHLNYLQEVGDIIDNVEINNRTVTITYRSHLTYHAIEIEIFERLFIE